MASVPVPAEPPQARRAARRRYVTVMFSDVSGSSEHAQVMDPEEYAEVLERFRGLARAAVEVHGGSITRMQGDGLLALFGHAETRENDAQHAAEAALELHAAVAQLAVGLGSSARPMQLHSGIHAGLVLLLEGDIELGRYEVVGEVPNTAARLSAMAGAGEVYVSAESLGPMAQFFETHALGELTIRGRRTPLGVLRVARKLASGRRIDAAARRGSVGFVGRKDALATLAELAQRCREGEPAVVLVRGEPGIGKTRLTDEFLGRLPAHQYSVLRGFSEQGLGSEPLQPFMQILRGARSWRAGFTGAVAAVHELVESLSRERPVILMLDDWQWADELSRKTVQALRERGKPVLCVIATRPTADLDPALAGARLIDLQPLDKQEAMDTVAAWLPDANAFVVQDICSRGGGSPLFIEELCHAAGSAGGLRAASQSSGVAWLDSLIASRLDSLPPAIAEGLRVASVLGVTFSTRLLTQALERTDIEEMVDALVDRDFLLPSEAAGTARFKHLLTRDAVYATVPLERRRWLHLRAAGALLSQAAGSEEGEHLEALSYHFNAAAQWDDAARYAEAAGDKALAAMSLDRARAQYATALGALDCMTGLSQAQQLRWCAIAQRLGQTCVFDALDVDGCLPLFERATRLATEAGDEEAMARAHYWLGYVYYGKGRPRLAVAHCRAAALHAQAGEDARLRVQVHATLGQALASAGHYDEALPMLRRAYEDKRRTSRPGSGAAIGSAYTLARTGYTLGDIGRFDEAAGCFDEAFHLLGDLLHPVRASVLELLCAVHLWQGRWQQAEAAGLQGAEVALKCRSRFNTEMGRALAACATWAATGDAAALQTLRSTTQWIESHGGAVSTSLNYGWLVEGASTTGLYDEARRHAARLRLRARLEDRQGLAQGLRALACAAAQAGDEARAARWLDESAREAARRGSPREQASNTFARAQVARFLGQHAGAAHLAASAREAFAAMGMAVHEARARELMDTAS